MTPQELRNSILQLAAQGKLVSQRAEDGTGEELYRIIQEEKKVLLKAKTGNNKPLPDFDSAVLPLDIPDTWHWVHLNDIAESMLGKTLNKSNDVGEVCPYLCSINVYWNGINLDTVKQAKFTDDDKRKYRLRKGDLLICEGGDAGRCAIWTDEREMFYQNALHRVRFFGNIEVVFFRYLLELYKGIGIIDSYCKGVTIKHLVQKALYTIPFPLPPFAEQKRIVEKIEELMPLVDQYEVAWNRLEKLKKRFPKDLQKSVLQYAVQGKLVEQRPEDGTGEEVYKSIQFEKSIRIKKGISKKTKAFPSVTDDTYIYEMPNTWKKCYLGEIAFVTKLAGFEYTDYVAPSLGPKGIPLIKGKNVQDGRIVFEFESFIPEKVSDQLPRSQIRNKCLLTPYVGTIGNIALFNEPFRAHLGSNVGKIELINGEKQLVLEEYVLFYLRSAIGYSELSKSKKATAQESISIGAIRNVIIPIPPTAEQKRIVKKVEEIMPLVNQCAIT